VTGFQEEIRTAVAAAMDQALERFRAILREERSLPPAADPNELWKADRAAKAIGKTTDAFRRAHERGTLGIEAVRIGKRSLRWRAGDVLALGQNRGADARRP
jgi:hypothetical protein